MTSLSFSNFGKDGVHQRNVGSPNGNSNNDADGFVDLYDSFALQLEKVYFKGYEDAFDVIKELGKLVSER